MVLHYSVKLKKKVNCYLENQRNVVSRERYTWNAKTETSIRLWP